jgi:rRNA processing protein Krr1/Pno1
MLRLTAFFFWFVNFHIGKGGSTLKRLKHETGTRIDVVKGEDFVKIKGTDENIEQARQAIDALVKEVQTNELESSHLFYRSALTDFVKKKKKKLLAVY